MLNKKGLLTLLISSPFLGSAAHADQVNLNITGKVIAAACTVDNSGIYNVDLGQNILSSRLNSATPYSDWKTFDVTLSNCPTGTSSVTASFLGPEDTVNTDMYANDHGVGYAEHVAIEIQRTTGSVNLGNGKMITVGVDASKTVTFDLRARVHSTGHVTSGLIKGTTLINFTYN